MSLGNLSLTLANAAAVQCENAWKAHKRGCPRCSQAQRHREPAEMCGTGGALYEDRRITAADLAEERRLAKQPNPNQAALFEMGRP